VRSKKASKVGKDALSADEIAAINIYTQETPFYKKLNELLRTRNRDLLKPFFPYLKILLTGMFKLTPLSTTVFRGVKADLCAHYQKGKEVLWWNFSSTTASINVLQSDLFLGSVGARTLFSVKVDHAVDIRKYSAISTEDERLVLPGHTFKVKGTVDLGGGLTMIQIEQTDDPILISGFSFKPETEMKNLSSVLAACSLESAPAPVHDESYYLSQLKQLYEDLGTQSKVSEELTRAVGKDPKLATPRIGEYLNGKGSPASKSAINSAIDKRNIVRSPVQH